MPGYQLVVNATIYTKRKRSLLLRFFFYLFVALNLYLSPVEFE